MANKLVKTTEISRDMQEQLKLRVKERFRDITSEDINLVCFEMGTLHAEENYGDLGLEMTKKKEYWNWWSRVFENNTKKVLKVCDANKKYSDIPKHFFQDIHECFVNEYYISDAMKTQLFKTIKTKELCQK